MRKMNVYYLLHSILQLDLCQVIKFQMTYNMYRNKIVTNAEMSDVDEEQIKH